MSQKLNWDEKIPDAMAEQWNRWLADLPLLSTLTVPRCLKPATASDLMPIQLHHFSDASELAYGAVVALGWVVSPH